MHRQAAAVWTEAPFQTSLVRGHSWVSRAAAEPRRSARPDEALGGGKLSEMLLYLIVTGVNSIMVVTLSRNAERMDAMRQRMMIMGHTLPLDS